MEITIVPDGDYVGRLTTLETKESTNGHRYLEWRFIIDDGPEADNTIIKRSFATTPKALEFMQQELKKLGISATSAEALEDEKHTIMNKRIKFTVQQNENGSLNVYIQGIADDESERVTRKSLW